MVLKIPEDYILKLLKFLKRCVWGAYVVASMPVTSSRQYFSLKFDSNFDLEWDFYLIVLAGTDVYYKFVNL